MTRAGRGRAKPTGLSESWDAVDDNDVDGSKAETSHTAEQPVQPNHTTAADDQRRRSARRRPSPVSEPQLVMPSSPDGSRRVVDRKADLRASTPHFRLNERSLTGDAGRHTKMRASTPHFRANQRSMTSDAGLFKRAGVRHSQSRLAEVDMDSDDETSDSSQLPRFVWTRIARPILRYGSDVVGHALHSLKPLLGYFLLVYVLVGAIIFGTGFLTNSINNALTPLCRIPGARFLHLPFCPSAGSIEPQGPAEFDRLVQVQAAFDEVLSNTAVGVSLPLDMKRSEASIRDLKHVVQYSTLPSRNELVFEFEGFVETARQASQDLSRFNTRIGRAVDHILSTNRWTLTVIEGVGAAEEARGGIGRWLGDNLNIFAPFQPVAMSRDVLLDQYLRHTSAVEEQILALISEAQALLAILENLDGRLDVISAIATRDGVKVEGSKDELFAALWTKLGGNRGSVQKLQQQISLLKQVGAYRRLAWAHITTTIVKLQAIRDNLEDLRERVALPEVVGTEKIPLEVHINSINLGIERLEQQRDSSRQVEADSHARVLSRVEDGNKRLLEAKAEL